MKSLSSLFILGFMLLSAQSMAKATTCRQTGNGVCAVDSRTNQCTHEWSRDNGGDPMFFCKKYIGQRVSNYNRANYTCKSTGSDDHTSPMRACKRHLGQVTSSFDRSKYRCSNTGGGVCARSIVTNQCTHSWDRDDTPNPMYACKLFLSKK
jgi:hypothetical protein